MLTQVPYKIIKLVWVIAMLIQVCGTNIYLEDITPKIVFWQTTNFYAFLNFIF